MVLKWLEKHDTARINKKFPIFTYYHIITYLAVKFHIKVPDDRRIQELWQIYWNTRIEHNDKKTIATINALKTEMHRSLGLITRFYEASKNIQIDETDRPEFYTRDSVGYLSHEESE